MTKTLRNYRCAALADEARQIVLAKMNANRGKSSSHATPPAYSDDVPWRGIFKVGEEMAELQVELAKLAAFPSGTYPDPDHSNLLVGVIEEATDVKAALDYFLETNGIPINWERYRQKREKFSRWGLTGVIADTSTEEV